MFIQIEAPDDTSQKCIDAIKTAARNILAVKSNMTALEIVENITSNITGAFAPKDVFIICRERYDNLCPTYQTVAIQINDLVKRGKVAKLSRGTYVNATSNMSR